MERFADIDTVVFDKTGTLTLGKPELVRDGGWSEGDLALAGSLALASRHPLSRALAAACPGARLADGVTEVPGRGLLAGDVRLGSRLHVGLTSEAGLAEATGPELWLSKPGRQPIRFCFMDELRPDAAAEISRLKQMGLNVELLSGDREAAVRLVAEATGMSEWRASRTPAEKVARLAELSACGRKVLMVGDGLNDAPALASATVSMSPSTAVDVSQTAADVVFQGRRLYPVAETLDVARRSRRLVIQNFFLAIGYNVVTVPMAVAGFVTPLIAAIAMSTSSLVVIVNALRLAQGRGRN